MKNGLLMLFSLYYIPSARYFSIVQKVAGTISTLAKSGGDMSHPQITPMVAADPHVLLGEPQNKYLNQSLKHLSGTEMSICTGARFWYPTLGARGLRFFFFTLETMKAIQTWLKVPFKLQ